MSDSTGYTPRVAIVTGSAKGIGYSIAQRLADDGVDIVINDLPSEITRVNEVVEGIKKKGRRAIGVVGDVGKEDDVKALVEKAAAELGSVDIMVANAGIAQGAKFLDVTVAQIDAQYAVNVRGVFLCYKYAALQMIKQGKGGRLIGTPFLAAYCGTKFAVRGLTQTAAIELREHGITVNAYAPGVIDTTLLNSFAEGEQGNPAVIASKKSGLNVDIFPPGSPDMVASMVAYLAKAESRHVNGQTLSVDGGIYMS